MTWSCDMMFELETWCVTWKDMMLLSSDMKRHDDSIMWHDNPIMSWKDMKRHEKTWSCDMMPTLRTWFDMIGLNPPATDHVPDHVFSCDIMCAGLSDHVTWCVRVNPIMWHDVYGLINHVSRAIWHENTWNPIMWHEARSCDMKTHDVTWKHMIMSGWHHVTWSCDMKTHSENMIGSCPGQPEVNPCNPKSTLSCTRPCEIKWHFMSGLNTSCDMMTTGWHMIFRSWHDHVHSCEIKSSENPISRSGTPINPKTW